MNVINRLAAIRAAVDDEAVSGIGNTQIARQVTRHEHEAAGRRNVIMTDPVHARDVNARNDQHVHRRARIDVVERYGVVILVRDACRDAT